MVMQKLGTYALAIYDTIIMFISCMIALSHFDSYTYLVGTIIIIIVYMNYHDIIFNDIVIQKIHIMASLRHTRGI